LILREGLMVAFFLAGLVVLGGQQQWWLEPLIKGMDESTIYYGATILTSVTDNAALTYLGSQVEGLSPAFQYALVSGAVTGGGLTVIANAPNPAGYAILRGEFQDSAVNPGALLLAALPPTLVTVAAFRLFDLRIGERASEFRQWLIELPPDFAFLLSIPFLVALAALLSRMARFPRRR
jgi:hypothetical protein